jgi:hypothetical protein
VRFQVLTAATLMTTAFWDIAPCSFDDADRRFRATHCLHHQGDKYAAEAPLPPFAWLWPITFPTGPAKIQPDPTDSRIYNSFLARERQRYTKGIKKRDDATKNHSTKNFDGHYSLILDYGIFVSESIPSDCTLNVQSI